MIDTLAFVAGSSLVTRQVVEYLKDKGWIHGKLLPIASSIVINSALAVGWAALEGVTIDRVFVYAVVQTVISTVYHDIKKKNS